MVTEEKINTWLERKKVKKFTQYKKVKTGPYSSKDEKMYDYYLCDYCRMVIKIKPGLKSYEQEGGKIIIPASLIKKGAVEVAAHNRCIKNLIKELEEVKENGRL